jgi:hypothetical protein
LILNDKQTPKAQTQSEKSNNTKAQSSGQQSDSAEGFSISNDNVGGGFNKFEPKNKNVAKSKQKLPSSSSSSTNNTKNDNKNKNNNSNNKRNTPLLKPKELASISLAISNSHESSSVNGHPPSENNSQQQPKRNKVEGVVTEETQPVNSKKKTGENLKTEQSISQNADNVNSNDVDNVTGINDNNNAALAAATTTVKRYFRLNPFQNKNNLYDSIDDFWAGRLNNVGATARADINSSTKSPSRQQNKVPKASKANAVVQQEEQQQQHQPVENSEKADGVHGTEGNKENYPTRTTKAETGNNKPMNKKSKQQQQQQSRKNNGESKNHQFQNGNKTNVAEKISPIDEKLLKRQDHVVEFEFHMQQPEEKKAKFDETTVDLVATPVSSANSTDPILVAQQ